MDWGMWALGIDRARSEAMQQREEQQLGEYASQRPVVVVCLDFSEICNAEGWTNYQDKAGAKTKRAYE